MTIIKEIQEAVELAKKQGFKPYAITGVCGFGGKESVDNPRYSVLTFNSDANSAIAEVNGIHAFNFEYETATAKELDFSEVSMTGENYEQFDGWLDFVQDALNCYKNSAEAQLILKEVI